MEDKISERKKRKEELKKKKMEKFAAKQKLLINKSAKSQTNKHTKYIIEDSCGKSSSHISEEISLDGQMKDLSGPMGQYDPITVERGWFSWWEHHKFFKPETVKKLRKDSKGPFVIPIPPPNVTGKLHIGHAMMIAIQDAIARYKRMQGFEVLFVPGTDHAGIATQTVVEKKLFYEKGLTRHDLGRDSFVENVWKWKEKFGSNIVNQIKRMGTSVDMDRFAFTLDEKRNKAVVESFVTLYEKGLIYRDKRLVNWSSRLSTAISDLEIEYKDIAPRTKLEIDGETHTFGLLYHIKYPIINKEDLGRHIIKQNNHDMSENNNTKDMERYKIKQNTKNATGNDNLKDIERYKTKQNTKGTAANDNLNIKNVENQNIIYNHNDIATDNLYISEDIDECLLEWDQLEYLSIATTRPETILGDTAICVNPNDRKSEELSKKIAINPLTKKMVPIIFDEFANLEFGTGMLKITPAHDFKDFDIGKKHKLKIIQIFDEQNRIKTKGDFFGLKRFEAREKVIDYLKEHDLFIEEEEYKQTLPFCSRSGDILEPLIKKQWWMNCKKLADRSIDCIEKEEIELVPSCAKTQWNHWLKNIRDWCLSRQLWWGHRIPAYRIFKKEKKGQNTRIGWSITRNREDSYKNVMKKYSLKKDEIILEQDEDVLDTWFSSAFWPFSIMGWPEKTSDFKKYFPADLLETGSDILFFWVARMVMCSFALFEKAPFKKILLHGIVRDANGRKMSKSLGNVIDPIHVIEGISLSSLNESVTQTNLKQEEIAIALDSQKRDYPNGIPRCGADALRFSLCSYTSGLKDINLNILRVEGYRKFANKIWNAFKFIKMQLEKKFGLSKDVKARDHTEKTQNENIGLPQNINKFHDKTAHKPKKTHEKGETSPEFEEKRNTESTQNYNVFKEQQLKNRNIKKVAKAASDFYKRYFNSLNTESEYFHENILEKMEHLSVGGSTKHSKQDTLSDKAVIEWIMLHRNALIQEYIIEMENFNFMAVTQKTHHFIIFIFCDIFIEITKKTDCVDQLMACLYIFKDILLLLHPFMPFLTEDLFQRIKNLNILTHLGQSIVIEPFPTSSERVYVENDFSQVIHCVKTIRSMIDAISDLKTTNHKMDNRKMYKIIINKPEIAFYEKQIKTLCKKVQAVEYHEIVECDIVERLDDEICIGLKEMV